ncbi:MAG TPA: MXAN_6640 family putative metalloprotease [Bacteroidota bacterium]|nr:MXAN_6640 family putative metalloprotease [Bacteroidota bacterium]
MKGPFLSPVRWCVSVLFVLVFSIPTGKADAGSTHQQSAAAAVREALASALSMQRDTSGCVKCGFPLCAAAFRARATAPAHLQPLIAQLLSRAERQKKRTAGQFTVHYDTTGIDAPALLDSSSNRIPGSAESFVDSVLSIANTVYTFEVDSLGFLPPPSDGMAGGGPEYDIYIDDLGLEYGETTPDVQLDARPDGGTYTCFMTIDNDFVFVNPASNRGIPALRVTIAHEFHHAIQLGNYGYWTSEIFFYELTSVWMETMTFPAVMDYLNYIQASWGHFRNPGTPFTSNDIIMYSRCIWGIYLAQKYGTGIMLEIWQDIHNEPPLAANETVIGRHGSNFPSAFSEWNLWNYYTADRASLGTYYPAGRLYPRIAASGVSFSSSSGSQPFNGTLPSLSAGYYDVAAGTDTGTVIITNLDAATALSANIPLRPYTLTLSNRQNDATFDHVVGTCYYAVTYDDPSLWKSWVVAGGSPYISGMKIGDPFPNPFRNNGTTKLSIPADAASATMRIYDSGMSLIYESALNAGSLFGRTVFTWDGITMRGRRAASGVYFYTLEYDGGTLTGKFVILRNAP